MDVHRDHCILCTVYVLCLKIVMIDFHVVLASLDLDV